MNDPLPYRAMGWLAIINALLIVVPLFIAPIPPLAPGANLVAFNIAHHDMLVLGNYLGVIQLPVGLILLVFIAAAARAAEAGSRGWLWLLIFGAGMCVTAVATVLGFFFFVGPFVVSLGQAALALLGQVGFYSLDISFANQALLLGVIALAVMRLRFLPAWLGYLAWLMAILSALATLGVLVSSGPLAATSPAVLFAGGFSLPVWLLLAGIYWLVHPAARTAPVAAA
ncbi:MAG TPA: hypothetical protein VHX52_05355 [Steroidobacteraceae bacterium]|jgi:hypothetical protein|nr:hypothetical protein [Steroidobacteraceae bacterium]